MDTRTGPRGSRCRSQRENSAQYERNGARLDADRVVGCPVDLGPYEGRRSTYYAYRAALRWHAASRGVQAVRDYDNARKTAGGNSSPEATPLGGACSTLPRILLRIRKTRALALLRI